MRTVNGGRWTVVVALIALLPLVPAAHALNSAAGTSGAQFLKLGAGARAGAMGEAQVAVAGDVHAAYYNPAGLLGAPRPTAAGMHDAHFQGIAYEFAGFSYPFRVKDGKPRHAAALSITNLSANGIARRTEDTDLALGTFGVSDSAYNASYAYRATDRLGLGVTVKMVRSKLDNVAASAFAVDGGVLYRAYDRVPVDVGLVVRNAGTELKWGQGKDPLPLMYGAGAAAQPLKGLTLALDVMKARDTDSYVNAGVEYRREVSRGMSVAVRGGYTTHYKDASDMKGWSAGLGLGFKRFDLDVAWIPFGDLGPTYKYSLLVRF